MTYTLAIVISRRVAAGGKSKSSAEELRGCDDAETRLLLEVRWNILLRRSPQVAAPCRTLCRVTSVCSAAVQRAESAPLSFALSSNAVDTIHNKRILDLPLLWRRGTAALGGEQQIEEQRRRAAWLR